MYRNNLALAMVLAACGICVAQPCNNVQIESETTAINILAKESPSEVEPNARRCIEAAIDAVSQFRSEKAVPELTRYIGFKRDEDKEPQTVLLHPYIEGRDYPAVVALSRIGAPAREALLKLIESPDSSTLERQNAAHALVLSFLRAPKEDPGEGIRFIRKAESAADTRTREQMEQAISFILRTPACQRFATKCTKAERQSK